MREIELDIGIETQIVAIEGVLRQVPQLKIVADGAACVGKGKMTSNLAEGLGLEVVGTGNMYRAITHYLLSKGINRETIDVVGEDELRGVLGEFEWRVDGDRMFVVDEGGEEVEITGGLHRQEITDNVPTIARRDSVRDVVGGFLRDRVMNNDKVVAEGRDMWEVFAGDENVLLVYLYASDEELIRREIGRQGKLGVEITEEQAIKNVIERGKSDNQKTRGKLWLPDEVLAGNGGYDLVINTTGLDQREVYLSVLEKVMEVYTYAIYNEWHNLANFAPIPVTLHEGQTVYPTSEQLYQAAKFLPKYVDIREAIRLAESPSEAKRLARENAKYIRTDWDERRYAIMAGIIRLKVKQNPDLQTELLATNDVYIYEDANQYAPDNPTEKQIGELRRWGIYMGEGENWIGKILMDLRNELVVNGRW